MEIILGILSVLFMGAIVGSVIKLIFRKWNIYGVAYLTAAILGSVAILIEGFPSLPLFILRLVSVTLIVGTFFGGILAIIRRMLNMQTPHKTTESTQDHLV